MVRHTLLDRFNLEPAKPSITLAAAAVRSNDVLVEATAFKNYPGLKMRDGLASK